MSEFAPTPRESEVTSSQIEQWKTEKNSIIQIQEALKAFDNTQEK